MKEKDIRIESWQNFYRIIHIPTGLCVSGKDQHKLRLQLSQRVELYKKIFKETK